MRDSLREPWPLRIHPRVLVRRWCESPKPSRTSTMREAHGTITQAVYLVRGGIIWSLRWAPPLLTGPQPVASRPWEVTSLPLGVPWGDSFSDNSSPGNLVKRYAQL